jgi:hypothetical protein
MDELPNKDRSDLTSLSEGLRETLALIMNGLMIAALVLASVTDMGLAYQ